MQISDLEVWDIFRGICWWTIFDGNILVEKWWEIFGGKLYLVESIQWKLVGGKYFVEWEGTRCSATAIWEGSKNPISQRKGGGESSQLKKHLIFFWFIQLSTGYLYDL